MFFNEFYFLHSTELPNLKGVGQIMEVWVSGSSGGELVVVVGEILGDVAYPPCGGGDDEESKGLHPNRHG